MKRFFSYLYILLLVMNMGCKATAQALTTHQVKRGETLSSIARMYNVTPEDILRYNRELSSADTLQPNTMLVVPSAAKPASTPADTTESRDREPIGFTSHRVRNDETLYAIASRYSVSEEELKRYNRSLYSEPLMKKMVLRVPRYKKSAQGDPMTDSGDLISYTVQPKETRWSIVNKHGISIDSLLALNPSLPETTNYLAVGQELMLPKIAGSTVEGQQVQLYDSYTVPPKKTLYSLSQEYGISGEEIVRLNPEIAERNGLKEGMVIRLPKRGVETGEINTDNYIFYEVKPKQTEYTITRSLGITWRELTRLNPELSRGLKAGMVIKLPKAKAVDLEVKNSLVLDKINLKDSIHVGHKPKLVFLLPFRLDKINLEDKESTINAIERSNAVKYSLGLYAGALVALDSIADLGVSVDVKTIDTQLSLDHVKSILRQERFNGVSAIIGPLDQKSLNEVAVQAAQYKVPVIAPISSDSEISLANVFFTIPADTILRGHMLGYMENVVADQNMIIIADENNNGASQQIIAKFPQAKIIEVKEEEKNISIDLEKLTEMLSEEVENWIFVESDNVQLVPGVTSILNSATSEKVRIRMFTTNKNKAFENDVISTTHLSNLKFTYPSAYRESGSNSFIKRYQDKWGSAPDRYAVRGFDITFDLLLKLAYKASLFDASEFVGVTEYSGNKFDYVKNPSSGYYNTAAYIMTYDSMYIKEVTP